MPGSRYCCERDPGVCLCACMCVGCDRLIARQLAFVERSCETDRRKSFTKNLKFPKVHFDKILMIEERFYYVYVPRTLQYSQCAKMYLVCSTLKFLRILKSIFH